MPYNPGVNDISGQIWGNTISNVGNTIANTISAYKAKTDENKSFDAKSKSVENLIKTHASDFGLSKEEMDAMLSRNPDETPKERYERLNGHIDQSVISHQMKQWKAQSEQQENMKAAFSQNRDLNQWMNGQGRGVYSPEVQKQMQVWSQDPLRSNAARLQAINGQVPSAKDTIDATVAGAPGKPMMTFPSVQELQQKYPGAQYDYNFMERPDGSVSVDKISPRAAIAGQIEPGYEPDPTQPGAIRPIKGSSAWQKSESDKQAKQDSVRITKDRSDTIINTVDAVLPQINKLTSGFGGTVLSKIPSTDANNVRKTIDTIKSALSIEQMQQMRAASKNGASGFGQLSEKELDVIQSSIANLDQDQTPEQLSENLNKVKTHFNRFKMYMDGVDPDKKGNKMVRGFTIEKVE